MLLVKVDFAIDALCGMCVIWDSQQNGLEDIDRILERIEDASGASRPGPPPLSAKKHVLYVEHRCGLAEGAVGMGGAHPAGPFSSSVCLGIFRVYDLLCSCPYHRLWPPSFLRQGRPLSLMPSEWWPAWPRAV